MDDYEMKPEVQEAVAKLWDKVSKDNIKEIADLDGYWDEFYEIFGFGIDGVDYDADVASRFRFQVWMSRKNGKNQRGYAFINKSVAVSWMKNEMCFMIFGEAPLKK